MNHTVDIVIWKCEKLVFALTTISNNTTLTLWSCSSPVQTENTKANNKKYLNPAILGPAQPPQIISVQIVWVQINQTTATFKPVLVHPQYDFNATKIMNIERNSLLRLKDYHRKIHSHTPQHTQNTQECLSPVCMLSSTYAALRCLRQLV